MSVFIHREGVEGYIKNCPISSLFALATTIMFAVTIITGGFKPMNLFTLGGLHYQAIEYGEYFRLITSIFLHGSIMHYLFNTFFGIIIIGGALEKLIGSFKYFFVFMISGIFAGMTVYFLKINAIVIGASGSIYGVLGVFLFVIIFRKDLLHLSDRQYIRNLLIINVIFTFIVPGISIAGHIGGLFAGSLLAPLVLTRPKSKFKILS